MILYPKLAATPSVQALALKLGSLSVMECWGQRNTSHAEMVYSPTGGNRATPEQLEALAQKLTEAAKLRGYPQEVGRRHNHADSEWSAILHSELKVTPHEAADDGMWHFISCALVPDLVRWRWGAMKDGRLSDRWLSVGYGGRNCFGRLWWRAELLRDGEAPYGLLSQLGEDELVQIMERPYLAGHRRLSVITAKTLLEHPIAKASPNRSEFFRQVQKRLLRIGAFMEFDALSDQLVQQVVHTVFEQVGAAVDED